ncbi:unnamed protein product [Nesidiocoris tenuis]|uniref:Uncharacterized protein n=1 Tax=Nesidiocoris tenuis TaxID=355587 RepID=A0A6H5HJS0_9HEMI|nr:unnamed protein product [Nesidiocoris tenuis]
MFRAKVIDETTGATGGKTYIAIMKPSNTLRKTKLGCAAGRNAVIAFCGRPVHYAAAVDWYKWRPHVLGRRQSCKRVDEGLPPVRGVTAAVAIDLFNHWPLPTASRSRDRLQFPPLGN